AHDLAHAREAIAVQGCDAITGMDAGEFRCTRLDPSLISAWIGLVTRPFLQPCFFGVELGARDTRAGVLRKSVESFVLDGTRIAGLRGTHKRGAIGRDTARGAQFR